VSVVKRHERERTKILIRLRKPTVDMLIGCQSPWRHGQSAKNVFRRLRNVAVYSRCLAA